MRSRQVRMRAWRSKRHWQVRDFHDLQQQQPRTDLQVESNHWRACVCSPSSMTPASKFGCGKQLTQPPATDADSNWTSMPITGSGCSGVGDNRYWDQSGCHTFSATSAVVSRTRRCAIIGRPVCGKPQLYVPRVTPPSLNGMASSLRSRPATGSATNAVCCSASAMSSAGSGNRSRQSGRNAAHSIA